MLCNVCKDMNIVIIILTHLYVGIIKGYIQAVHQNMFSTVVVIPNADLTYHMEKEKRIINIQYPCFNFFYKIYNFSLDLD